MLLLAAHIEVCEILSNTTAVRANECSLIDVILAPRAAEYIALLVKSPAGGVVVVGLSLSPIRGVLSEDRLEIGTNEPRRFL